MANLKSIFLISLFALLSFFVFRNDLNQRVELLKIKTELGSKDNPIKRAAYEFRMLKNPATGEIPKGIREKEIQFAKNILSTKEMSLKKGVNIEALEFSSRGPINRGGRVRALAIDIRSTESNSVIIAAGVSGGIWRSTNNGVSWVQTSLPSQLNSATCIAQDTRSGHQDIWYVGTGESYGNSAKGGDATYLGNGIYKSTDNGLSWALLPSTSSNTPQVFDSNFDFIHSIAVNPTTGKVYAAAINTIVSSNNGGDSWELELSTPTNSTFADVVASPTGIIYASINSSVSNSGIWKSTNDGDTWSSITPSDFPSEHGRTVIAIAPSDENKIYLLSNTPGVGKSGHSFWASSNGGSSWTNYSNNLPDTEGSVAGYSSQNNYNMVIAVKPNDPNFIVFGGTNLHRSTNGMTTKLTNTYANWIGGYSTANDVSQYANHHPDQHALVFAPYNSSILYSGNDGGVQVTNDVSKNTLSWMDINNGFITSQFYSIAMDNATIDDAVLLGGLQDNGNYFVNSMNGTTDWVEMIAGGDGAITAIADGKSYYYIETQNGNVMRLKLNSAGDYETWTTVQPDYGTDYLFINPYVLDPNNTKMMYFVAGDSLWRNSDLTAIPNWGNSPTSVNWTALTNTRTGDIITAVAASKTPANIVYYGTSNGQIFKLSNANVGNPSPINISSVKGMPGGYVSSLAIDANNANNLLAVFSNYSIISLYYTSDGGNNWTAVAGNLEENPDGSGAGPSCRWASILNYNGKTTFFVATSAGLYSTSSLNGTATTWLHEAPNKVGVAVCTMVRTRDVDGTIVVATHGTGVFSAKDGTTTPGGVLLSENFDASTFPPSGWSVISTNASNTWTLGNPENNNFNTIDPTSINSAICPWVAEEQDEIISTPLLIFPNSTISLNFYAGYSTAYISNATIKLLISTDDGSNWTPIWEAPNDGLTWRWREFTVDLSQYANNDRVKLAWNYIGNDGDLVGIDNVEIANGTVDINEQKNILSEFNLAQNYPNPFNPTTSINYSIPNKVGSNFASSSNVSIKVYDILGREVATLVNKEQQPGNYTVKFDASQLTSGTYFYRLNSGGNSITKKMLLIK